MTLTERQEQLTQQLRDATAQRDQLAEQLQSTTIGIHQLQGALAIVQALLHEEATAEQKPNETPPLHAVKPVS